MATSLLLAVLFESGCDSSQQPAPPPAAESPAPALEAGFAGSARCQGCHADEFERWRGSHHSQAERAIDPDLDRPAFERAGSIEANGVAYRFEVDPAGRFAIESEGRDGVLRRFPVVGAFGFDPFRQYLLDAGDGHWQVSQLAYDPERQEWFDVFGEDTRKPGDWGHWTGRGMNWNSRCAHCHNTGVRLDYDDRNDRYATRVEERGVGCEACHGPASDHAAWHEQDAANRSGSDPLTKRGLALHPDRGIDTCMSCHTRRSLLDEDFLPGDRYLDHFQPAYLNERPLYHPDGQVLDEDFVGVSFLSSTKFHAGLRCTTCHEPHAGETIRPGDALCLECHRGMAGFELHGGHDDASAGNSCIGCHMPITPYMQRDPRRDHLFSIPDPALTIELGIPNACNRCHEDRGPEWSQTHFERWYPDADLSASRRRAHAVASARRMEPEAVPSLVEMSEPARPGLQRATATRLLGLYAADPSVLDLLKTRARDEDPWVRMAAATALIAARNQGAPGVEAALRQLIDDPIRAVRVEAARGLRAELGHASAKMADLRRALLLVLGQPTGRAEFGSWLLSRGDAAGALPHLQRSASWDPWSPEFKRLLGIAYASLGRNAEALASLEAAAEVSPDDPLLRFELALAYSEVGRREAALRELRRTVEIAPDFTRAWYNMGLALRDAGQTDAALEALASATRLEPSSPAAPYASSLILMNQGEIEAALGEALLARERAPEDPGVNALIQELARRAAARDTPDRDD